MAFASEVAAYDTPPWLFAVEGPVASQTDEERVRVSKDALLTVLTRVTGLLSIPRTPVVRAALADTSMYYNEFRFFERRAPGAAPQRFVEITFQPSAVVELAKAAQLPVWWTQRPVVLAWVVLDENGQRRILGADSDHPLRGALQERARARGVELRLPLMDLDDQLDVTPADVWGRVADTLQEASRRYDADLVVTARLRTALSLSEGQDLRGDWEFWLEGTPHVISLEGTLYPQVAAAGVDGLVERLVERFAVLARQQQRFELHIGGLKGVGPYAAMMSYLEGLDFVDAVQVTELSPNQLIVQVDTAAREEQLLMLLTAEDRLAVDRLHRGPGVRLTWRG